LYEFEFGPMFIPHSVISFYNPEHKCLLRGKNGVSN